MQSPAASRLMRNVANRRDEIDKQLAHGTFQPTAETMAVILRHTLGILQAVQVAVVTYAEPISS